MLPGEKDRRRKEVIARKRLERAQDKDGLHVEVRVIASQMLDFYYANTADRRAEDDAGKRGIDGEPCGDSEERCRSVATDGGKQGEEGRPGGAVEQGEELLQRCVALDLHAGQTSDRPQAPQVEAGTEEAHEAVEEEVVVDRVAVACAGGVTEDGGAENQEEGEREEGEVDDQDDESWMESDGAGNDNQPSVCLPPLSGPHLQAAKKLAQYIRLAFEEQGGGKQRRLRLTVKPNSRSLPDLEAVKQLVAKMDKTETEYATTKRLPQFGSLPQAPGTEAHVAAWHGATTGFGARMLESMGFDLSAHQQGIQASSTGSRSVAGGSVGMGAAVEEVGSAGAGGLGVGAAEDDEDGGGAQSPAGARDGVRDSGSDGSRAPVRRPQEVRRLGGSRAGLGYGSAE